MTWTNSSKPTTSYTNTTHPGDVGYIVTDDLSYVLLGTDEAQRLIWRLPGAAYINTTKPA